MSYKSKVNAVTNVIMYKQRISPLFYQNHLSSFNADKELSVLINGHMSWV